MEREVDWSWRCIASGGPCGHDQLAYADLALDNMMLAADCNLHKLLMLQQVWVSNLRLGYSMSVFSSNQTAIL